MDIHDDYHYPFLDLIEVMAAMKSKNWDKTKAPALFKKLVQASAKLECTLPVYWNTLVRHMLICRFIPQLNQYGSFWVIAMLVVECYHIHIKRCGSSRKNIMKSVVNNYEIFDILQTEWKEDKIKGNELKEASYPSRYDMQPEQPINIEESLGKRQKQVQIYPSEADYRSILLAYKIPPGTPTSSLIAKWASATLRKFCYLHEWDPAASVLSVAERKMKALIGAFSRARHHKTVVRTFFVLSSYFLRTLYRTTVVCTLFVLCSYFFRTFFVLFSYFFRTFRSYHSLLSVCFVQKITRAHLGETMFCTPEYQDKFYNDNTCIKTTYNDQSARNKKTSCYGRIQRLYYHQLHQNAAPKIIVIADWFDEEPAYERSRLVQVRYNPNFKSESAVFLNYCDAVNFSIWPTDPFTFDFTKSKSYRDESKLFTLLYRYTV
jgi:hypothetical protein